MPQRPAGDVILVNKPIACAVCYSIGKLVYLSNEAQKMSVIEKAGVGNIVVLLLNTDDLIFYLVLTCAPHILPYTQPFTVATVQHGKYCRRI